MKSLDYIKQRISDGTTGLTDCNYESMTEINTIDIFEKLMKSRNLQNGITVGTNEHKIANISYDPNSDFNYFTMSRNINDGTLIFDLEAMQDVLYKVLSCQTYNKSILKDIPDNEEFFNTHIFKYVIGDIVLCQEYSKEFSTKEKPWMTRRTTALLPIKFEVIENADWTHDSSVCHR